MERSDDVCRPVAPQKMKIVVACDSFKGSLSSLEAGEAVRAGICKATDSCEVKVLPLADGGEGSIDSIAPFIGGIKKYLKVKGPLGDPVDSYYICSPDGKNAYIEIAKASGLTLIAKERLDPFKATTYGSGELIKDAVLNGARRIFVFLGGSATNDGGAGMLKALGARLTDRDGNDIPDGAKGLKRLCKIDVTGLIGKDLELVTASDVINPLCGPLGASFVYGPQKGAAPDRLKELDDALKRFAQVAGLDPYEEGTGAAGGLSFALKNFLSSDIKSGAKIVTEITGLEDLIKDCDIVITGEGRIDRQTLNGKAPYVVMKLAKKYGKKVIGVTGIRGEGFEDCLKAGFDKILPLKEPSMEKDKAIRSLTDTVFDIFSNC